MFKEMLKTNLYPTSWCPGCGIGQIAIQLAMVMDELGLNHKNSTLVSGVGCTARLPEYFNIDGSYTLHGRTLPFAEAVKLVNPELEVIVVSGPPRFGTSLMMKMWKWVVWRLWPMASEGLTYAAKTY